MNMPFLETVNNFDAFVVFNLNWYWKQNCCDAQNDI